MSARRPLLTALGATTLLAALWFVPSAGATSPGHTAGPTGAPAGANSSGTPRPAGPGSGPASGSDPASDSGSAAAAPSRAAAQTVRAPLTLADTGSVDTTPYVLGGTLCLGLGAAFVTFSVHRSRTP
ncbi:hypothetical protein [Streptomyces xanthophaeus]|uniref:hypothetical protein n=1 Tax=Streptomyces xanthophaeus TaxID=67385 RepID=UPI0004CCCE15|nr:hypothetical protein [Streptomyces xanthophaeus]